MRGGKHFVVPVVAARGGLAANRTNGHVIEHVFVIAHLKQFLAHFFDVRGNRNEITGRETDQNVPVTVPLVRDDGTVVLLEGELERIVRIQEFIEVEGAFAHHRAHLTQKPHSFPESTRNLL